MTALRLFLRRLRRERRGAALIEFAFLGPVFLLLLMGIFDYGWQLYARQVLQGAVAEAARGATLETNMESQSALDERVAATVRQVFGGADISFSRKTYDSFEEVGNPEPFRDSMLPLNDAYDEGECFEDINGNGKWDADRGRDGNGGADDVVLYTVSMEFRRVLPVWRMLGESQHKTLTATTVLRNQPFNIGADANVVRCE